MPGQVLAQPGGVVPTGHTHTHAALLHTFLGVDIRIEPSGERAWEIVAPVPPVSTPGTRAFAGQPRARAMPRVGPGRLERVREHRCVPLPTLDRE